VLVPVRSQEGYGNHRYWPIWEAAAEHGLAVGIAGGGAAGTPPTPVNWLATFAEDYVSWSLNFETQLISLVMSGLFRRWPDLKITMMESGWTWLPAFLWRMDAEWKQYHREVPWLEEPPSAYVRRHFRFTTQPVDAPADDAHMRQLLDQLGDEDTPAASLLLYASDFPHHYGGGVEQVLRHFSPDQQASVMGGNAAAWYGLDARTRPDATVPAHGRV
jgi:predicted TIM-barrel fold metal-dependent hydrolase